MGTPSAARTPSWLSTGLAYVSLAALGIAAFATLGGFLGRLGYPWELFTHFRPQLAVAGLAFGLLGLSAGLFRRTSVAVGVGVFALNAIAISLALRVTAPPLEGPDGLRIVWAHLDERQTALWAAAGLVREERADIVGLTALPENAPLRALFPDHPCVSGPAEASRYAVAVLSREPCAPRGPQIGGPWPHAVQRARMRETLTVVAVHAPRPIDWLALTRTATGWRVAGRVALRNEVISAASDAVWGDPPALLVGDFNAAPWAPKLAPLSDGRLIRADCGAPWRATWPTDFGLFGVPMDQVFVTPGVAVTCRLGPSLGAPHRPLILDAAAL